MAKLRRGTPPLFELLEGNRLRRGDVKAVVPGLRLAPAEVEGDEPPPSPEIRLAPGEEPAQPPQPNAAIQFLGDRLHLSLTPVTAAIGLFVVSLVVVGGICWGQRSGQQAAIRQALADGTAPGQIDGVEKVREQPPASHLIESLTTGDARPAAPPRQPEKAPKSSPKAPSAESAEMPAGPQTGWVRDFTYIMAQEFPAGRMEDARRAQEFLAAKGFATEIIKLDSGALQLITLEGYNHKDAAQKKKADSLLKKERAAGAEFFASGGGYKLEGYFKTLKKDRW